MEYAMDWLGEMDRQGQTDELMRVESEYMRDRLQAEDDANHLPAYYLEQMD